MANGCLERVKAMDGTVIDDGLQPIDGTTPFLADSLLFSVPDTLVQAPPAAPVPPLIPQQQIGMTIGPSLNPRSSFSRQARREKIWCLLPFSY